MPFELLCSDKTKVCFALCYGQSESYGMEQTRTHPSIADVFDIFIKAHENWMIIKLIQPFQILRINASVKNFYVFNCSHDTALPLSGYSIKCHRTSRLYLPNFLRETNLTCLLLFSPSFLLSKVGNVFFYLRHAMG